MAECIIVLVVILFVVRQVWGKSDSLTGLPNRKVLIKQLNKLVNKARRNDSNIVVVLLELDHFERINEARGSLFGDELLRKIGHSLQQHVKGTGTVGRIRADRFGIIFEDNANKTELARQIDRIYAVISHGFSVKGIPVQITFSAGMAVFPFNGESSAELIKNAYTALYQAKETGRNQVLVYSAEMSEAVERKNKLGDRLHGALQRDEFVVHYQPQFEMGSGNIRGFAASIHWEHPELGRILPEEFIPIAKDAGLVMAIEEWMMREACEKNRELQKLHFPHSIIAIPVSSKSLNVPQFLEKLKAILNDTGMASWSLELEVMETELEEGDQQAQQWEQLHALGIPLCMAGFGKDYASLHRLQQLPIRLLKIDPLFIKEIGTDQTGKTIIQSLITLGHKLGLPVIAAGVETYEQLHYLRAHTCNYIQGSLVSKPLPYEELPHLFAILQYKPHALKS